MTINYWKLISLSLILGLVIFGVIDVTKNLNEKHQTDLQNATTQGYNLGYYQAITEITDYFKTSCELSLNGTIDIVNKECLE